jgi:hypothetical protein
MPARAGSARPKGERTIATSGISEAAPSLSRTFTWVLQRLADARLVKGKTIGIDATTLEANAALRSIVRCDTGESYESF